MNYLSPIPTHTAQHTREAKPQMSNTTAVIAQFEKAQVAKFDSVYSATLKHAQLKIKSIKALGAMCARVLEIEAEKNELRSKIVDATHSSRELKKWFKLSAELGELYVTINEPKWKSLHMSMIQELALIHASERKVFTSIALSREHAWLRASCITALAENTPQLCALIRSRSKNAKLHAECFVNPGNIKTLKAMYHANPTRRTAAKYAAAARKVDLD